MVSSYLPYPLHSGGHVRLYNLIKELSDKHEITLICEKRSHQTESDVAEVEKICKKIITVSRKKQWSIGNIVTSAISGHSFLVTGHTHPQMQQEIQKVLLEEKFDLIHVETFYVFQNLPVTSIPAVLVDHNIEYHVYERFKNRAPLVMKPLLAVDISKIKKEEETMWKQASRVVAVSEKDQAVMRQAGVLASLVSNGVDVERFSFKTKSFDNPKTKKILFIGDFKWLQNRDSVSFIIKEIWPNIRSQFDVKLWIVARDIPESIRSLTNNPKILFDTESSAKSAPEIFQEADVLLAPIRVGGGTSYKILESMSCGTPVVTMPLSANAINAVDGEHLLVGRVPQELADKTVELLENSKMYKNIAVNARKLIEENYSWKKIAKELEDVYKGVLQ